MVGFLFTDIEGSTRLWEHDAQGMWSSLERHHDLVSSAIRAHNGVPFKTVGDAFQAAFPTVRDAVFAATEAQRALAAADWSETGPIRVRMAIHVGEADPVDGDYTAPCLNRLARLLGTGSGGQVLATDAVRHLVDGRLPDGVTFLDLGVHHLKDLLEPERVSQLVIAGLPDHFPPIKSLERHLNNLPIQPTTLIGRTTELATISTLFKDGARLITLTGAGGSGKTRLALQVTAELLEDHEDGAFFVDLAPVTDPALIVSQIATTLGVRESGAQSVEESLVAYLTGKHLFLVLDNFEQVLSGAPGVAKLLSTCPHLNVLATSRAPLLLRGEHEFPVDPLPVPDLRKPDQFAEFGKNDAVDLFTVRAHAVDPAFDLTAANAHDVAAICARLDGLPLAIELAAAWTKMLPPPRLLAQLEKGLPLSRGARDLPERQRSLRATIAWSYDLLSPVDQSLFAQLAVFAGGFTLDAASEVIAAACEPDMDMLQGIAELLEKNLLRRTTSGLAEPRYSMLETIREFALDRLQQSEQWQEVHAGHAKYYLRLAEKAETQLIGPDHGQWLDILESNHDNLRASLGWFHELPPSEHSLLRMAGALWRLWYTRGYLTEGRLWLARALQDSDSAPPSVHARALNGAGVLAHYQGEGNLARQFYEQALALLREIGDSRNAAYTLVRLGSLAADGGDYERATSHYLASITEYEALEDKQGQAMVLGWLAELSLKKAEWDHAAAYAERNLTLGRELQNPYLTAIAMVNLGEARQHVGELPQAIELYRQALPLFQNLDDKRCTAYTLCVLGTATLVLGDATQAWQLLVESVLLFQTLGDKASIAECLEGLGKVAISLKDPKMGIRLFGTAEALRESIGVPLPRGARQEQDQYTSDTQTGLDQADIADCRAAGRAIPYFEAIKEAAAI
jgi:predicted ATPase/class 3 adenylate cyclase